MLGLSRLRRFVHCDVKISVTYDGSNRIDSRIVSNVDAVIRSRHVPQTRVAKDRAIFHALCVVDEAQERARSGPVPPTAGLRLGLAFLHLCGAERNWIDQFWKAAVGRSEVGQGADAFGRSQEMTAAVNAITRAVGVERSTAFLDALRAARGD